MNWLSEEFIISMQQFLAPLDKETSVENFTLPVGSKPAYAVMLRDGALTAVVLFSS